MKKRKNRTRIRTIKDLGMKLRVPYNQDPSLIDKLADHAGFIDSVYLAPNSDVLLTSGSGVLPPTSPGYDRSLKKIIGKLDRMGIKPYLLLNAHYVDHEIIMDFKSSELRKYLRKLRSAGLKYLTVTDILLAQRIHDDMPDLRIEASVNARIDTPQKAFYWKEYGSASSICFAYDINKRIGTIKSLRKASGLPLTMLVFDNCIPDCPYEIQHGLCCLFARSGPFFSLFDCAQAMMSNPWLAYSGPIVVPYNLRYYKGLVSTIKLSGRYLPTSHVMEMVKHWAFNMDSRSYYYNTGDVPDDGSVRLIHPYLMRLVSENVKHPYLYEEPADVFKKVTSCDRICPRCGWCLKKWEKEAAGLPSPGVKFRDVKILKTFFDSKVPGSSPGMRKKLIRKKKRKA